MAKHHVAVCLRDQKATFTTETAARKVIVQLKIAGANEAELLRAYRCITHHGWHLGRVA